MIQPGQQHSQRGFSTAIAANQKQHLPAINGQIDRTYRKIIVLVAEHDVAQLQRFPVRERLRARELRPEGGESKLIELSESHLCAKQRGQRAYRRQQRCTQEQQRQRVRRGHVGIRPSQAVRHPKHQTNRTQHHDV
ncbi:hypothetical protein D3C78_1205990 [compost metagenome]